jgi:hypothetical protein
MSRSSSSRLIAMRSRTATSRSASRALRASLAGGGWSGGQAHAGMGQAHAGMGQAHAGMVAPAVAGVIPSSTACGKRTHPLNDGLRLALA